MAAGQVVTSDKYTEPIPALTLPGAMAFGDWPDVHECAYPPRIECLQQYPGELPGFGPLSH